MVVVEAPEAEVVAVEDAPPAVVGDPHLLIAQLPLARPATIQATTASVLRITTTPQPVTQIKGQPLQSLPLSCSSSFSS